MFRLDLSFVSFANFLARIQAYAWPLVGAIAALKFLFGLEPSIDLCIEDENLPHNPSFTLVLGMKTPMCPSLAQ
jgi:hypothetical protein